MERRRYEGCGHMSQHQRAKPEGGRPHPFHLYKKHFTTMVQFTPVSFSLPPPPSPSSPPIIPTSPLPPSLSPLSLPLLSPSLSLPPSLLISLPPSLPLSLPPTLPPSPSLPPYSTLISSGQCHSPLPLWREGLATRPCSPQLLLCVRVCTRSNLLHPHWHPWGGGREGRY